MPQHYDRDEFGGVLVDDNPQAAPDFTPPPQGDVDEFGGVLAEGPEPADAVEGLAAGLNQGLASGFGFVVDTTTAAINAGIALANNLIESVDFSDVTGGVPAKRIPSIDPSLAFGGSASIERGFSNVGIATDIAPERRTEASNIAQKAGNVAGASVPFAALPGVGVALGRTSGPITSSFARNPTAFSLAEAGGVVGASQGAAAAELLAPGNEKVALGAEIVGGLTNPVGAAVRAANRVGPKAVTNASRVFTKAGRERRAAEIVEKVVIGAGEDPAVVARALTAPELAGVKLPSGVKSGSRGLLALERSVSRTSPKFGAESQNVAKEGLENLRLGAERLAATGNPDAMRVAALARSQHYERVLDSRLKAAQAKALETAHKFNRTGGDRGAASLEVAETLKSALREARRAESDLWGAVPKKLPTAVDNLRTAFNNSRSKLLDTEDLPLPKAVRDKVDFVLDDGISESGDLLKLRNRLLAESKRLRASQDFLGASISDELAAGVLDDLAALDDPAIAAARDFSRTLHDKFTRTFAGQATAASRTGAERISPESFLDRAFVGKDVAKRDRFDQIFEAAGFADDVSNQNVYGPVVRTAQEEFLRAAAANTLENGVVNPAKMATFLKSNQALLQRFPEAARDFADAETAARVLRNVAARDKRLRRGLVGRNLFARLIGTEDIDTVVQNALFDGRNRQENIARLASVAKRGGPAARDGLQTSALDGILTRSRGADGVLDFNRSLQLLDAPPSRTSPSLSKALQDAGIASKDQIDAFRRLLARGAEIQQRMAASIPNEQVDLATDALSDFIIRVGGARLGASVSTGPSTLIAAGAGSRFLRSMLERVPAAETQTLLVEAARNPEFAAKLLKQPKTRIQKRALGKQINAFLLQAGLVTEDEENAN